MKNIKTNDNQHTKVQAKGFSKEYQAIIKEVEKWPAWKIATYNINFATSAHSQKIACR